MQRKDGRTLTEIRPVSFETRYLVHHPGSVLVSVGHTKIIVSCTVENRVPPWRVSSGEGWLSASYNMIPAATHDRKKRSSEPDGRAIEIQRLISRSLRNVVNLKELKQRTLHIDCDVIQADGGTRCAAICGAWVALVLAVQHLLEKESALRHLPLQSVVTGQVAAISIGVLNDHILTDLCYEEDSSIDTDFNLVARADGSIVELQGTAEGEPLQAQQVQSVITQALSAIQTICTLQRQALEQA